MCGITAVLALAGRSIISVDEKVSSNKIRTDSLDTSDKHTHAANFKEQRLRQDVVESLRMITHRGPDFCGSWCSDDGLIGENILGALHHDRPISY